MTATAQPWMGGNPDGQWANHYELLGLPVGFDDTETIVRIADELLKRIEGQTPHNHSPHLQTLKNSVLQAKTCLTDGVAKAAYDQQLADLYPDGESPSICEIPEAIPVVTAVPTISSQAVPFQTQRQSRSKLRQRRRSRFWFTIGSVLLGGVLFASLVLLGKRFLLDQPPAVIANANDQQTKTVAPPAATPEIDDQHQPDSSAHTATTIDADPTEPANGPKGQDQSVGNESPRTDTLTSPNVDESSSPTVETPEPLSQQELEQLSKALNSILPALGERRFQPANNAIQTAREIAQHPSHMRLVDELAELTHYTQEYWAGMDDAWEDLKVGEELVVGSTRVNIVEVSQERMTLRVAGTNKRFSRDELPAGLRRSIIDRWLDQDAASTHLIWGAYYATKSPPDSEKARDAWREAKARGGEIDLLLPVLSPSYDVERLREMETGN